MWDYVQLCAEIFTVKKKICVFRKKKSVAKNISLNNSDYGLSLLSLGKPCLVGIKVRGENIVKSEKHSILENFRNILKCNYCSDVVIFTCFTR